VEIDIYIGEKYETKKSFYNNYTSKIIIFNIIFVGRRRSALRASHIIVANFFVETNDEK